MRLVIDCFKLVKGKGKSIGIYNVALGIVRHLGEINSNHISDGIEIVVLGNNINRNDFDVKGIKFIEVKNYNPFNKMHLVFWELLGVTRMLEKLKADKVFFPRGFSALTHTVNDIVLVHDYIPFYYNEYFPGYLNRIENAYVMWRLKASVKNSKKIITISQASKEDIVKYSGVDEKKIVVIHNGCEELENKFDKIITAKYICAMTSKLPHKNAKGIIQSYIEYCKIVKNPLDLVIIGLHDTNEFDVPNNIRDKIKCYRYVESNDELHRIIAGSEVFLFLSLVEGFGLPPVEAIQLGIPVICSNVRSLQEIVGEVAITVDPTNYAEVAHSIANVLADNTISAKVKKESLIIKENFSWKKASKRYWEELIGIL